ncbi:MAG: DNA/RNA non-specific endonuclease, partial [Bacteroidota bacterium]
NFLGVKIDLPTVDMKRRTTGTDGDGEIYLVQDYKKFEKANRLVPNVKLPANAPLHDPFVLRYHHYSLVMNRKYRMCMFTASNCDYRDEMRKDPRKRSAFGSESWKADPRVPLEYQLLDKEIYQPARNVDRGHVHRREDNCWGSAGMQTEYANSDTYHWTNCTPQHELFNQENPAGYDKQKGIWGWFEGELEEQIHKSGGQAVLFAGPVLDEQHGAWQTLKNGKVFIPYKFWKVVVVPESTARNAPLLAYGFLFDQSDVIQKYGLDIQEALELPDFKRQQVTIEEISTLSGVVFDKKVRDADQHPGAKKSTETKLKLGK